MRTWKALTDIDDVDVAVLAVYHFYIQIIDN